MNRNSEQFSFLSLSGLIISVIPPFLYVFFLIAGMSMDEHTLTNAIYVVIISALVLPVPGLIISIVGTVSARRNGKRGTGCGIAGIVVSSLEILFVLFFVGASLLFISKAEQPQYTVTPHNSVIEPQGVD